MLLRSFIKILLFIFTMHTAHSQPAFEIYPVYTGSDLGLTYTKGYSRFRIWSPPAEQAEILLYQHGESGYPYRIIPLTKDINGTWVTEVKGDLKGIFYTFKVFIHHVWSLEVTDPYARAAGVNGKRACVIDEKETDPPGWAEDKIPSFSAFNLPTDSEI